MLCKSFNTALIKMVNLDVCITRACNVSCMFITCTVFYNKVFTVCIYVWVWLHNRGYYKPGKVHAYTTSCNKKLLYRRCALNRYPTLRHRSDNYTYRPRWTFQVCLFCGSTAGNTAQTSHTVLSTIMTYILRM